MGQLVEVVLQLLGGLSWGRLGQARRPDPSRIVAALRVSGRRGRLTWRDGYLDLSSDAATWRRHRFLGRRVPLPGLRVGRDRAVAAAEPWWTLSGARVFSATAQGLEFEVAVHSSGVDTVRDLCGARVM